MKMREGRLQKSSKTHVGDNDYEIENTDDENFVLAPSLWDPMDLPPTLKTMHSQLSSAS